MTIRKTTLLAVAALSFLLLGSSLRLHAQYVIDSLDGEVTQNEVHTFISTYRP